MAETIYIGNNIDTSKAEVIFNTSDFIELIRLHMGPDAAQYACKILELNEMAGYELERELQEAYDEGAKDAWAHQDLESYENGREDGYDEGYSVGYSNGYSEGFADGCKR